MQNPETSRSGQGESAGATQRSEGAGWRRQDRRFRQFRLRDHRPPWWPEGEEWPPRHRGRWRRLGGHNPFFRRLGCLFVLLNLLVVALFVTVIGVVLNGLGIGRLALSQVAPLAPVGGILLALGIAGITMGALNLRRISRPLDDLLDASSRVAEGDFTVRADENGPREVRSMARAFNLMAARLQTQDEQRRSWLADVTHELRTPLTILQGNLEGIVDDVYTADKARLKSMLEEVQVLSRLTDDLRVLALAEGGNLGLKTEPTDLTAIIQEAAAASRAQADASGIDLKLNLETGPKVLEIDPERIRQVLNNLLFNGLRYTPAGKAVNISLSTREEQGRKWALVSVEDEGPGISAEDLPHVFDRYFRGADSHGMGLGLAIAKHIVEAHGGRITVSSEAGAGTKVSFTLPE